MYSMDDLINSSDSADSNDNKSEHKETDKEIRKQVLKKYAEVKNKGIRKTYDVVVTRYRETLRTEDEIQGLAYEFVNKHKDDNREEVYSQGFWLDFFNIFGIASKAITSCFEYKVGTRKIDLFMPKIVLIEQKSEGKNLDDAYNQALKYLSKIELDDLPQYIIVSDFKTIRVIDLDLQEQHYSTASTSSRNIKYRWDFLVTDLVKNLGLFKFLGAEGGAYSAEFELNNDACELISSLYKELCDNNKFTTLEAIENIQQFLAQTIFCLFAEKTTIFFGGLFTTFIKNEVGGNGADLSIHLLKLYQTLNQNDDKRPPGLSGKYKTFPYVNGNLFDTEHFEFDFNNASYKALVKCTDFAWDKINPMIFGSLFQEVMETGEQRAKGAHYTSEENILKLINDLFVKDLEKELLEIVNFNAITPTDKIKKIEEFIEKLRNLKFFDPACGSGNFLILAYKKMREIELKAGLEIRNIILTTEELRRQDIKFTFEPDIKLENFIGIDMESYAVKIAKVAMWLMEHQCNVIASETLGKQFKTIPLKGLAEIHKGNSLEEIDWQKVCPKIEHDKNNNEHIFILGNPPFIGARYKSREQAKEMETLFKGIEGWGDLDYVTCWFKKASDYIQGTKIQVAFVATNSICQGSHVGSLWRHLILDLGIKINFAHQSFKWSSEIKNHANVYCVIVGFATFDKKEKYIYGYEKNIGQPQQQLAKNIAPYLIDSENFFIEKQNKHIQSFIPKIYTGNKPIDDGNYIFTKDEMIKFIDKEPLSKDYFYRYLGSIDLIRNTERYVLMAKLIPANMLSKMPNTLKRIENVKKFRNASKSKSTNDIAITPTKFHIELEVDDYYIAIPVTSSENRDYIPIAIVDKEIVPNVDLRVIKSNDKFLFGVLTSRIHMDWTRQFAGRLESRYRYSAGIVYNNFPFPDDVSDKLRLKVIDLVDKVLEIREKYFKDGNTLADLYGELTMPADLRKAHIELDKAVELCYRKEPFNSAEERIAFLLRKYDQLVNSANS